MRNIFLFTLVLVLFAGLAFGMSQCRPIEDESGAIIDGASTDIPANWRKTSITLSDGRHIAAIPAVYETIEVEKLIAPERTETKTIPAVMETLTRRVVKIPASTQERMIPAVTKEITIKVLKSEARLETKTVAADVKTYVHQQGTRAIKKDITLRPAVKEYKAIPAIYEDQVKVVEVQKATTEIVVIPPVYETVTETVVKTPERIETIIVPTIYETEEKRILISPARLALFDKDDKIIHDFQSRTELARFLEDPTSPQFNLNPFETKTVTIKPQTVEVVTIPAAVESVNDTVVVQNASVERVIIPATFETIDEAIVVKEASVEHVVIPAQFKTVNKTITIKQASQGQPAVTQAIATQELVSEATFVEKKIPALIETISKRVVKTPASTAERVVPSVTKQTTRRVIKTPAQAVERVNPAQTVDIVRAASETSQSSVHPFSSFSLPPIFTWPADSEIEVFAPPPPGWKLDIPNGFFKNADGSDPTLTETYTKLAEILSKFGYENKWHRYPHGFVILTKAERIDEEARTIFDKKDERIDLDAYPVENLEDYLQILFSKPETRYRYLAFIITARDEIINDTGEPANAETLDELTGDGLLASDLPLAMNNYKFNNQYYKAQLWIYEFAKIDRETPEEITSVAVAVPANPTREKKHKLGSPALKEFYPNP